MTATSVDRPGPSSPNKPPIRIAVAQSLISADVRANGREIRGLMHRARAEDAAIIHFPEGAMSGCSKAQIMDWDCVDWGVLVDQLESVAGLARDLGLWVVVGCSHRLTPPHRPQNSLYIISSHGEVATRYDKRFLSHTEITGWHTPGQGYRTIDAMQGCPARLEVNRRHPIRP
jgi:predicted amidohydrolase